MLSKDCVELLIDHPEIWLKQLDNQPRVVPIWPASKRMAVVCVTLHGTRPIAHVLLTRAALDEISNLDRQEARLYFTIPKSKLLDSGYCGSLDPSDFELG